MILKLFNPKIGENDDWQAVKTNCFSIFFNGCNQSNFSIGFDELTKQNRCKSRIYLKGGGYRMNI